MRTISLEQTRGKKISTRCNNLFHFCAEYSESAGAFIRNKKAVASLPNVSADWDVLLASTDMMELVGLAATVRNEKRHCDCLSNSEREEFPPIKRTWLMSKDSEWEIGRGIVFYGKRMSIVFPCFLATVARNRQNFTSWVLDAPCIYSLGTVWPYSFLHLRQTSDVRDRTQIGGVLRRGCWKYAELRARI
jgi:hypothetical protein